MALPAIIALGKIDLSQSEFANEFDEMSTWCSDTYTLRITAEELLNLRALAKKYPKLTVTDNDLNKVEI